MWTRYARSSRGPRIGAALAVAALAVTGCVSNPLDAPTSIPTGVLSVSARSAGDQYVLTPQAVFVASSSVILVDSRSTVDTCRVAELPTPDASPNADYLDAGDSIGFDLAGTTRYLKPMDQSGVITYALGVPDVPFMPDDEFTFDIPGGSGFPAATISSSLAPVLTTLSPIPASPPTDQPLTVSWAPVGDAASRFEISLQYASVFATELDVHVLCAWRDDGAGVIRGDLLAEWAVSNLRRVAVARYRTERMQIGQRDLFLLARFDSVPEVQ